MNKSQFAQAGNQHPVVTPHDIGSFVEVTGVGKGTLRYVGPIHGKDGMFCGVELDQGIGKHNGTYEGVQYFICPPEHGIFAPMYKVVIDDQDDVPMLAESHIRSSTDRLSRSALPSLQFKNVFRPSDPMTSSIYTDTSLIMDSSMISNTSWTELVDMAASGTTFVIPQGQSHLDVEDDLMAVQPTRGIQIDRDAIRREEQRLLGASFTVEKSRIGVEYLPIVEDEELETPLVEQAPPISRPPVPENIVDTRGAVTPQRIPVVASVQPQTLIGQYDQYSDEELLEDTVIPQYRPIFDEAPYSSEGTASVPDAPPSEVGSSVDTGYEDSDASKNPLPPSTEAKVSSPKTPRPVKKPVGAVKPMEAEKPQTPKEKEAPPQPKFPVKPKAPSKHQLMMEQIKASIEAEKSRPKKEVKPRISLLPPPVQPTKQKENNAESGNDKPEKEVPKRPVKQPLKMSNQAPPKPVVERPKKERKPLYVAPPPKERKDPPAVAPVTPAKVEKKPPPVPKGKSLYPTSSFAGSGKPATASTVTGSVPSTSRASIDSRASSATATARNHKHPEKKVIDETTKLKRLQRASLALDAMSICAQNCANRNEYLTSRLRTTEENLEIQLKAAAELKMRMKLLGKDHEEEICRLKGYNEQVIRSHSETIERIKLRHEKQLEEKAHELERSVDDERMRQEAEANAMSRRHQKVVDALDEKMAELEKTTEQLKADKKALQAALANDSDQRNQMLTKEINSLQTAMEFKSSEMKELRKKYQQVTLRVEEIPLKDLEITKLKYKVTELKQILDQKMSHEKMLVHQNEELKRQTLQSEQEKDNMQRSIDVMLYKYESGEDPNDTSRSSPSGTRVNFRSRSSNSSHRPSSGIPPEARLSISSFSDMERSIDRDSLTRSTVSMYASQYRLPENHANDVIYAPDEIITGNVRRKLSFSSIEEADPTNGNAHGQETNSAIPS